MADYLYDQPVKPRTEEEKKTIINRLKRIEGQVRGIQNMVEEDRYCIDILIQINAIQAALQKVGLSIAERHMNHCVAHALKTGDGDQAIQELVDVMKHYAK